MKKLQYW